MKKIGLLIIINIFLVGSALIASSDGASGLGHKFKYMTYARNKYYDINERMEKVVGLLEKEGSNALKKISAMNSDAHVAGSVFILNPKNGQIIVGPDEASIGKQALDNERINAKSIVQEAIRKTQNKLNNRGGLLEWFSAAPIALLDYYTDIAISPKGRLFVVAIGKNDLDMQRLFITKLVGNACDLIKESGIQKSIKVFDKKNSFFRFKDNYIFIYGADSSNKGTCIYNPNYPEDIGKNMIDLKDRYGYPIKELLKVVSDDGEGWVKGIVDKPGKKQAFIKAYYVKGVSVGGKNYAVGSGVYLAEATSK